MRLSGTSSLCGSFERQVFPLSGQNAELSSFLDEMKKSSDAAAAEKIKNSIEKAQYDGQLKLIYDRLSDASKNVLERLKTEKNDIQKDEWKAFCKELKDAGVISQSDFDYTRADGHIIPIGYYDACGNFIKYSTPPMLVDKLHMLSGNTSSAGAERWQSSSGWNGSPLAYLNSWASMLLDWKNDMSVMRAADGSLMFDDFSPVDLQINSCRKVCDLLKELVEF